VLFASDLLNVVWYENLANIGTKTANINVKTALYTNFNGDMTQ